MSSIASGFRSRASATITDDTQPVAPADAARVAAERGRGRAGRVYGRLRRPNPAKGGTRTDRPLARSSAAAPLGLYVCRIRSGSYFRNHRGAPVKPDGRPY
jgi:hypothetical protein